MCGSREKCVRNLCNYVALTYWVDQLQRCVFSVVKVLYVGFTQTNTCIVFDQTVYLLFFFAFEHLCCVMNCFIVIMQFKFS